MRRITVLHNQSLFDVCIMLYGNLDPVFELALANNLSITTILEAGTVLNVPESQFENKEILNYFKIKGIVPATALTSFDTEIIENNDECDLCSLFL